MDHSKVALREPTDMKSTHAGRTLFMTGATGFIGKVHLYKVLKTFPEVEAIYVLIRTKKGQSPIDRLSKEVFSSPCFDPLRKELGAAEFARRQAKVKPMVGDMMSDRLGLNDADYATLMNTCNIIIHYAATIDFQERLNVSVKMNVLGTLKILALAKKCKHLECLCHVSTCYTNWNRAGRHVPVMETLYPLAFDPEAMCKYILSLEDKQIPAATERLLSLYKFPNTYTFTKSITEHLLQQRKANVPLVIVRPSIVGCAWREPMPGWVDVLTSAGALFLTVGLGVVHEVQGNPDHIADVVPVDFVVNAVIKATHKTVQLFRAIKSHRVRDHTQPDAARSSLQAVIPVAKNASGAPTAAGATSAQSTRAAEGLLDSTKAESVSSDVAVNWNLPLVFQACTSGSLNRLSWSLCADAVERYWNKQPHPKRVMKAEVSIYPSKPQYLMNYFLKRQLPYALLSLSARLPFQDNKSKQDLVKKYRKMLDRAENLNFQFHPFVTREWVFSLDNQQYLNEGLSAGEREAFGSDPYDINWSAYVDLYNYGLIRYVMKALDKGRNQPPVPPSGAELFVKASL